MARPSFSRLSARSRSSGARARSAGGRGKRHAISLVAAPERSRASCWRWFGVVGGPSAEASLAGVHKMLTAAM